MQFFRKLYCRIPDYGQLVLRKGAVQTGWYKSDEQETYYSLMLKGAQHGLFKSNTFYLVFTETCFQEALKRGQINSQYLTNPIPFGRYTGIQHVEQQNKLKNKFDCIFLHVYKYKNGGSIDEMTIALSERQFRRAIVRAKTHPELCVKKKFWHGFYCRLYRAIVRYAES